MYKLYYVVLRDIFMRSRQKDLHVQTKERTVRETWF